MEPCQSLIYEIWPIQLSTTRPQTPYSDLTSPIPSPLSTLRVSSRTGTGDGVAGLDTGNRAAYEH